MTERAFTPSNICLSDPQGRDEAVAQEGAQKIAARESILGPIDRGRACRRATRRSPFTHPSLALAHPRSPWLTLLARWECLKRLGVGERERELRAVPG